MRCASSGDGCKTDADCDEGEGCVYMVGNVTVAAAVSAAGGARTGSGCFPSLCEIRASGVIGVAAPINVGGGKRGTGGDLTIEAGPGPGDGPGADTPGAPPRGHGLLVVRKATAHPPGGGGVPPGLRPTARA